MNCNLDLGLAMPLSLPATEEEYSAAVGTSNYNSSSSRQLKQDDVVHAQKEGEGGQQQLLTLFYKGRVCVSDVTELQAEAILRQARKETELRRSDLITSPSSSLWRNNMDTKNLIKTQLHSTQFSDTAPTSSSSSSTSGVRALKRSLERFLEKRKNRIAAAASPY